MKTKDLIKKGVEDYIAEYVVWKISRPDHPKLNYNFKYLDSLFKPVGGQNKGDIFTDDKH